MRKLAGLVLTLVMSLGVWGDAAAGQQEGGTPFAFYVTQQSETEASFLIKNTESDPARSLVGLGRVTIDERDRLRVLVRLKDGRRRSIQLQLSP